MLAEAVITRAGAGEGVGGVPGWLILPGLGGSGVAAGAGGEGGGDGGDVRHAPVIRRDKAGPQVSHPVVVTAARGQTDLSGL